MTVKRLRSLPSREEFNRMYSVPHDHRRWDDHLLRTEVTLAVAKWLAGSVRVAVDLSAGNGWLLDQIDASEKWYGDYAANTSGWLRGPIEQTVDMIPRAELFLCCETLEHLDAPLEVLRAIRAKTRLLVLSTPMDAWNDTNPEHLWAWDREGVQDMLSQAGFTVVVHAVSDARPSNRASYNFGIWGCH